MTVPPRLRPLRVVVLALAAAGLLGAIAFVPRAAAAPPRRPPNVIVIQADDQSLGDLTRRIMPHTWAFLRRRGTMFTHYVVASPQCCPSRASLITGQYPHNDGVLSNGLGYSGLRDKPNVLPSWLKRRGYFTVHIGKYLNGYAQAAGSIATPAPGWDEWFSLGGEGSPYYDYSLGANGRLVHYGTSHRSYITRVLERHALREIGRHAGGRRPLYLQLDERAPHIGIQGYHPPEVCGHAERPIPDPRDTHAFARLRLPHPPSFNEADVSDKPSFIRSLSALTPSTIASIRRRERCRLATLRGVDRTVVRIRRKLRAVGALGDTVVIYLSDNGVFDGEHRIREGKVLPYEEAVRQPLLVRVPPAYLPRRRAPKVGAEVANVDIAPTILGLARARPCIGPHRCRTLDGRSLVPLLRGRTPVWTRHRAILEELRSPTPVNAVCAFKGLELKSAAFTRYESVVTESGSRSCSPDDERELYNLRRDPFELRNELFEPTGHAIAEASRLEKRLRKLADCSGIAGRDPAAASAHYCD